MKEKDQLNFLKYKIDELELKIRAQSSQWNFHGYAPETSKKDQAELFKLKQERDAILRKQSDKGERIYENMKAGCFIIVLIIIFILITIAALQERDNPYLRP